MEWIIIQILPPMKSHQSTWWWRMIKCIS
jgi:hypothetical protein